MKSNLWSFSIATLLCCIILASPISGHDCSSIIREESEGLLNYLASVNFTVPKAIDGDWSVVMKTDVPFTFIGSFGVWVKSEPEQGKVQFTSRLENNTLAEGDQVSFRFRISWFTGEQQPNVVSLIWEGVQLCKVPVSGSDNGKVITSRRRRNFDNFTNNSQVYRRVHYRKRYFVDV